MGDLATYFEQFSGMEPRKPNRRVTEIVDRYELTFVVFYRDHSDLAPLRYQITESSKSRFANALRRLHEQKCLTIYETAPGIYKYMVRR